MKVSNTIVRVRNRDLAHVIARELAAHLRRVFGVRKYDSRTYEIFSQYVFSTPEHRAVERLADAYISIRKA